MKPFILFLATAALVAPLAAQGEGPGTDLIDLFEKSQREGATEEELLKMLQNKALIDLQGTEFRERSPEELQNEKDAAAEVLRRLKGNAQPGNAGRPEDSAMPEGPPSGTPPQPPRWFVGLIVKPLDPALRSHFDLPDGAGMVVESVMRGSPAATAGIRPDDILVTANGRKISTLEELKAGVEKAGSDGKALNFEMIHRGTRKVVKVAPRGPEISAGPAKKGAPVPENSKRPMIEIQRRLDAQQQEIEKLRREVEWLRERISR